MDLRDQMKFHELQAQYWLASATTGNYKTRLGKVTDGAGRTHTEEELLAHDMATAQRHITLYRECAEDLRSTQE